jgi:hypothetical protein
MAAAVAQKMIISSAVIATMEQAPCAHLPLTSLWFPSLLAAAEDLIL